VSAGLAFVFVPPDEVAEKLRLAAASADELAGDTEVWPAVFAAAANAYMLGTFVPTGPVALPPDVARLLRGNSG